MKEKTYRLPNAAALSIPAADVDALLSLGDGECALLYLHALRTGGTLTPALAARALGRTEEEILAAAGRLERAGLWRGEATAPLPGPEELPTYTAGEIVRRTRTDSAFQGLLSETQRVMGHALSGADLQTLFGIYDRLGLPPEVIMLLINHCAERLRRRHGEGRLPTMRTIEKEAFRWADREILTVEQAEELMAAAERTDRESERVRAALSLNDRPLSPTERNYLESWLNMGFGADALALAYDRTVVSTGRLAWKYMDSIVRSWHEKGLYTVAEIEKGDARPSYRSRDPRSAPKPGGGSKKGDDARRLEDILGNKTR